MEILKMISRRDSVEIGKVESDGLGGFVWKMVTDELSVSGGKLGVGYGDVGLSEAIGGEGNLRGNEIEGSYG